jgi:hypothetical protein
VWLHPFGLGWSSLNLISRGQDENS